MALANFYENGELPEDTYRRFMDAAKAQYEQDTGPLWPEEQAKFEENAIRGLGMLQHYTQWINGPDQPDARWEMVATEMRFSVPIPTPYGGISSRIFLAGRFDGVVRDRETGQLWLREYKTSGRTPDVRWLELDDQSTVYAWAAQQILGEPIAGIHYRFLLKKVPEMPRVLKNGMDLSRAINSSLATTYPVYAQALEIHAKRLTDIKYDLWQGDDKPARPPADAGVDPEEYDRWLARTHARLLAEYEGVLIELERRGSTEFFQEFEVRKTQKELDSAARDLRAVGLEMCRNTTLIYPAPDWLKCTFCPFRAPCKAMNAGGDPEVILKFEYRKRREEDPVDAVVLKMEGSPYGPTET